MFRQWLLTENRGVSPKILLPFIESMMNNKVIHHENLKEDYVNTMRHLHYLIKTSVKSPTVIYREARRAYEIALENMHDRGVRDSGYADALTTTRADKDLLTFVHALDTISRGDMPDLEGMVK